MPSKDKVTYGSTLKGRAKRLLEALLAYVNWELEDVGGISLSHRWQDETTKQPKLVIETQLRTLEFLTTKDKHEGKLTKPQIRQALNEHLKDFLHILEDNRSKTQGKEEWHFTLKLWSKDTQKNLEQFEIEWERLRPEKSKQQEKTLRETVAGKTPKPEDELINWQEICRQNLAQQKQLTTNAFTNANGMTPQLDEIYVPLGIVERKPSKPPSRDRPEEKEEEKLIPIAEERFFEDVLRQGQSEISQGRKIAIIGEPGSGKTTRLQKIADWILEQDLGLPIWVSLADLTQPTITQYIEEIWLKQTGQNLTIDALTQHKHRIWLLLDGLDEMTSKVELPHVFALLGGWVQAARVVVTCRVNVWEADKNAFSGFDVFRNLPFNPEEVTKYIRGWFAGRGDVATGESLEATLAKSENSRLKELIQNPLRLWMLCQIWQPEGRLPETQARLYREFVDWVYSWNKHKKLLNLYAKECKKTQRECKAELHQALGKLAKAAIDEVSGRFRLSYKLVDEYLGDEDEETSLLSLALSLGWLNRVERFPEAICVFYHATFQEYFAALAVEDWDYFLPRNHVDFPVVGKEYRIFEAQWKQVILLWLGLENVNRNRKQEFIEALLEFKDGCEDFYGCRAYFLTAAGIAEFKDCSRADEIVATIIKYGFGYFNTEKKEWGIFLYPIAEGARAALLQTNNSIAVNQLIDLLKTTEDKNARGRIADSLGKIATGNPEAIAALSAFLSTTNDEETRCKIAENLGKIDPGNPEAIAALIAFLSNSKEVFTLWMVAEILGEVGTRNPEVIAALIAFLSTINNDFTRLVAAHILPKIATGNPESIAALITILSTTNDEETRWRVAATLGKIDPGNPKAIAALTAILSTTNDEETRWKVAESLGIIDPGNPESIAALIAILSTTNDEENRWRVAATLGKIDPGNPEAIAALIAILSTTNHEVIRWQVAENLDETDPGNPEAIAALIAILSTTNDENNRWRVAHILCKIATGNPESIGALIAILSTTNDEETRWRVAANLGEIDPGNPKAIAALIAILSTTNDEETRWRVAASLGIIDPGNPKAIAALIAILSSDTNENVRCSVAESLGEIDPGNPEAIAALTAILSTTNDEYTRWEAAESLGEIDPGNPEAIAALIGILLTTTDQRTLWQVAESLSKIDPGHPGRIAALIAILSTTTDKTTRWSVADSLNKIVQNDQMPSVVSALQQFQCDTTYETNFDLYKNCFEIIWNCAQNLPYPTFYQAWHHQLTTPHPEVPETTGVGSTPFTQSLNLADLPKILHARLVETQLKKQKEVFSEILTEDLEDIGMENAIKEGENTETVSREQIFKILKRQP
ncbi:HEAT repeat domain-containing protein [Microcoleus sp. herbarium2]|uniref:HEAT repeat domain-containing protein n=1 Tax=Microcoleus sp. herbarium2 TaxID=3055433 RepID=UPI002FCF446E